MQVQITRIWGVLFGFFLAIKLRVNLGGKVSSLPKTARAAAMLNVPVC